MSERVLVCVLGQTRAHQATWESFEKNVLRALGADLAICIGVDEQYDYANPFWQNARYRWTAPEFEDYADAFEEAREWYVRAGKEAEGDWRPLMEVPDQWLGGIKGPGQHPGSGAIVFFFRWLLYRHLSEEGLTQRYDRFIVTRSDYLWPIPHPPLRLLDPGFLWMPDGEYHKGLPDRHMVASAADILASLDVLERIVLRPKGLARAMRLYRDWNPECVLKLHLEESGLLGRVRFFPYVMFTVRGTADQTRWAAGRYDEELGIYVKYPLEKESAERYAWIRSSQDWERLAADTPAAFHAEGGPPRKRKLSRYGKRLRRLKRIATLGIVRS